jgi:hypothetical protein
MIHPMEEANPYAPPVVADTLTAQPGEYRVEGRYLWVTDGVVLPRRCIRTNEPIGPEDFVLTLTLKLRPMLRLRSVKVTYYLLASEFRRLRRRRWLAWILIGSGILAALIVDGPWQMFAPQAVVVAAVLILQNSQPLTCNRCKGQWFQIRGPSRIFVRSLETSP